MDSSKTNQELFDEVSKERDQLKEDIERLKDELAVTSKEKHQSAELGLQLLDEKEELQKRFDDLELEFKLTKVELDELTKAFNNSQNIQKRSEHSGIEKEDKYLQETAQREANFQSQLHELRKELKQVRVELERLQVEKERLIVENNEVNKKLEISEWEKKAIRNELKDLKLRETRLLSDMNELEDENITLQKTVSNLKSNQVDYETAKHEVRRLEEELNERRNQVADYEILRNIAEKQMEEALEALNSEREQKYELKKKLDEKLCNDSLLNMSKFGLRFSGLTNFGSTENQLGNEDYIDEDHASPLLHQLENDYLKSRIQDDQYADPQPTSLFGEVHLTEIKKLEKKVQELQAHLDSSKLEYSTYQTKCKKAMSAINKLFHAHLDKLQTEQQTDDENLLKEIEEFDATKEFADLLNKFIHNSALGSLNNELKDMMQQLNEAKAKCTILELDSTLLNEIAEEVQTLLVSTEDELINLCEELSAIYYQVCDVNAETPNRIILDHVSSTAKNNDKTSINLKLENLKNQLSKPGGKMYLQKWKTISNDSDSKDSLAVLRAQIKHLKSVIDQMIGQSQQSAGQTATSQDQNTNKTMISASPSVQQISELTTNPNELKQMIEENKNNKALLATKREQIATLRMVIKANKQTAEVALENLKSKYESEKQVISETMSKLKTELKALKEDAATFASLRSMFAARCEEYVAQNDELQRQLQACEDEKKQLNSLLRIAIQQKLVATQKLEDYEMDRERLTSSGVSSSSGANNSMKSNNSSRNSSITSNRRMGNNNNSSVNNSFNARNYLNRISPLTGNNHSTPKLNNQSNLNSPKRNYN